MHKSGESQKFLIMINFENLLICLIFLLSVIGNMLLNKLH